MAYQVDILSTQIQNGAQFTVNTAVNSVDLVPSFPGNPQTLFAGSGTVGGGGNLFSEGDNFTILSAGYHMPENFVMAQYEIAGGGEYPFPIMFLRGAVTGGGPILPITQFGNNGNLRFPFENYEMSLNTFVDPVKRGLVGGDFELQILFPLTSGADSPQVSMINVPAALNGVVIYVTPFIKVLHNFTLT